MVLPRVIYLLASVPTSRLTAFPVIAKRPMAPGIPDIEGNIVGHDVIPVKAALKYFEKRGGPDFSDLLNNMKAAAQPYLYIGSTKETGANRVVFGEACNLVLNKLSKEEAAKKVMVIDSTSSFSGRSVEKLTVLLR